MKETTALLKEPKRKVLLVEDDLSSICLQQTLIEREGWELHVEKNVQDALLFIQLHQPALVLTDLNFPDEKIDGFDFLLQNHRFAREAGAEVIVVSGSADKETKDKASRLGARDFIAKPFVAGHYFSRIGRAMAEIEARGQPVQAAATGPFRPRPEKKDVSFENALTAADIYLLLTMTGALLFGIYFQTVHFF
jgi:CheY-like chemotaxis protein